MSEDTILYPWNLSNILFSYLCTYIIIIIIIYFLNPIYNVYKHTSSVDYTHNGMNDLKQYDQNKIKISNDLVDITHIYKYIKQRKDKNSTGKFVQKAFRML